MTTHRASRARSSLRGFSRGAAVAAAVVGCLVLAGWAFDITAFKSLSPGLLTMKPNTAFAFVLGGISLWIQVSGRDRARSIGRACAAVVALIGALTLSENLCRWNLGIDCIVFHDAPSAADPSPAGRMCPASSINLVFVGGALLLLDAGKSIAAAQALAMAAAMNAGVALLGYVFDTPALYSLAPYSSVALHTAGTTLALSLGVLVAEPCRGFLSPLTSDTAGGRAARRLLPAVILVPILLGRLALSGERWGQFGAATTTAISAVLTMAILAALIMWNAGQSHHVEEARRRSEERLAERTHELEALLTHAPVGFAFVDREGRHVRANGYLAELVGAPAEQLADKPLAEVAPERAGEIEGFLHRVFATGEAIRDVEMDRASTPSQQSRHCLASFYPVRDPAGDIRLVGAVVTDISAQKRAEKRLRASEGSLRRLWESNLFGVMYADARGDVADANDAVLELVGYSREELAAGRVRWTDMTPPEYLHLDAQGVAECLERGACTPYEKVYVRKDGRRVPVLVGYALLEGPGDNFICFVIDLTERAHLLESERAARTEAERASRLKDEFVATVSHELRTPLNAIQGWSHLLQRPRGGREQIEKGLGVIERNTRQLTQIVSDLLDTSRIVSGKLHVELGPVDLPSVVDTALEELRAEATIKGVELAAALAPTGGDVQADPSRIQQVVQNLVSNAIKFTPRGGRVEVTLASDAERVTLRVRDTGQGIEPAFLPFVFDRFRQADASTMRRHGGLGLGLAIVKHVVDLHGGTICASSEGQGKGAEFALTLPRAPARSRQHPRSSPPPAIAADLTGSTVLVVDDEPDARELAQRILEEHGASVLTASSGHEALDVVAARSFDVLVSDIGMPGMDGYELVRRLRARNDAREHAVPAVALTAFARPEDRARAHAAGFQAHVPKPVEPAVLVMVVATLCPSPANRAA